VKSRRLRRRRIPEDIILRNVSGGVWCVKTRLVGHKIYFQEGWKVFQAENCIGKADFLLFKYDGTNVFKVVILEQSSRCERREVEEDEVIDITEEEENEKTEDYVMEDEEDSDYENEYYEDEDDNYTEMEEESEEEHMKSQNHHSRASNSKFNFMSKTFFFCISYECMNQLLLMIDLSGSGDSATSSIPKIEGPHLFFFFFFFFYQQVLILKTTNLIHKCIFSLKIHTLKQNCIKIDPTNWLEFLYILFTCL